jgi:hypothetical protein
MSTTALINRRPQIRRVSVESPRAAASSTRLAARRRRQEIADVAIDSKVMLLPTADRGFKLAVALAVTLPSVHDPHQAVELVRAAHGLCPYSNATRGNVDVSLTANGVAVDDVSKPLAA